MKNLSNQKVPTVRPMILNSPKHRCKSIIWLLRGLPPNKQWATLTFVNPQHC